MDQQLKGTCFSALAAIIYGLIPVFSLGIYGNGGDVFSVVCIRSLIAAVIHGSLVKRKGGSLAVSKKDLLCLVLAAVFGITCTDFFLGLSYNYISGGLATTLHFIYPAACVITEAVFFKEKVTNKTVGALVCVISGVVLFSWKSAHVEFLGVCLALISGLCYTFYLVMMARSRLKELDVHTVIFYICCIEAILCGVPAVKTQSFHMNLQGWILAILLSILVNVLAASLFQLGIRLVGLSTASVLSTLEPLTSVVAGILVLHDTLGIAELCGCIMVCVGIAVLVCHKKQFE